MPCEICGSEPALKKAIVDGTELIVCDKCLHFGKEVAEAPKVVAHQHTSQKKDEPLEELKDNYGEVIRKAREARGLTIEELAASIFENASWLKKIEQGKLKPDEKLISKLERRLSIKLTGD